MSCKHERQKALYLTLPKAAEYVGVCERTIRRWHDTGHIIRERKVTGGRGKPYVYSIIDLDCWKEDMQEKAERFGS